MTFENKTSSKSLQKDKKVIREDTHIKKKIFSGRTTKVWVLPPLDLSG